ncbi:MAG: hypothetical protein DRR15_04870 [Gammaproteobacteria bacterium]|nr:MAG: hypothetical protein DRR15_04870 [Gammaproteobacteria bacterium]
MFSNFWDGADLSDRVQGPGLYMHDQFMQYCRLAVNATLATLPAMHLHKVLKPARKKKPPGSIEPGSQSRT